MVPGGVEAGPHLGVVEVVLQGIGRAPPPPPAGQKKRMMMKKPIKANKKNANKTSAGKKMTTATNKAKKTGVVAKVVLPVKKRRHVP